MMDCNDPTKEEYQHHLLDTSRLCDHLSHRIISHGSNVSSRHIVRIFLLKFVDCPFCGFSFHFSRFEGFLSDRLVFSCLCSGRCFTRGTQAPVGRHNWAALLCGEDLLGSTSIAVCLSQHTKVRPRRCHPVHPHAVDDRPT